MKVSELIVELQKLDPEMECIVQKDSEGNAYSPLAGIDPDCVYIPESSWSGEVYDTKWDADDAAMTEEEWEEILSMPTALVFFPVN